MSHNRFLFFEVDGTEQECSTSDVVTTEFDCQLEAKQTVTARSKKWYVRELDRVRPPRLSTQLVSMKGAPLDRCKSCKVE